MTIGIFNPNAKGSAPKVDKYDDCLRRCDKCGIAYSNGKKKTTLIYKNPLDNIPKQVQSGALGTLAKAINIRNRKNKLAKFAFETSEDAVTWTVFSHIHKDQKENLPAIYGDLFGIKVQSPPALILWGVPVPSTDSRAKDVAEKLESVLDLLGEKKQGRSEPDVLLDFGDMGLVIIEVKYTSGNDCIAPSSPKFDRYLDKKRAFKDIAKIRNSGLYELTRNWRIGWELAGKRPFTLINLGQPKLIKHGKPMTHLQNFKRGINLQKNRDFVGKLWFDFLSSPFISRPKWFEEYLVMRGLI